jgi:hypothetical protein
MVSDSYTLRSMIFWDFSQHSWQFVTDVSGHPIGPIFNGQAANYQHTLRKIPEGAHTLFTSWQKLEITHSCYILLDLRKHSSGSVYRNAVMMSYGPCGRRQQYYVHIRLPITSPVRTCIHTTQREATNYRTSGTACSFYWELATSGKIITLYKWATQDTK